MKSYEVITPLRRNGEKVAAGGVVELGDKEATPLLTKRAIAPVRPTRAAGSTKVEPAKTGQGSSEAAKTASDKNEGPKAEGVAPTRPAGKANVKAGGKAA
jgi:hypothetical protein